MNRFNEELIIKNLRCTVSQKNSGHIYANWTRETNALICVKEGILEIACNKGNVTLKSGECVFIPVGATGTTYFKDTFNEAFIFFFDVEKGLYESEMIYFEKNKSSQLHIRNVFDAYIEGVINVNYYLSAFYQLIYLLQTDRKIEKKFEKIHSLMLEIEKNYFENLKISDYAKKTLMSESGVRSLFKEYTGKSIIEYRNDVRLKRAEEFILGGMTASEAAVKVGFSSLSYYCRTVSKKQKEKQK